MGRMVVMAFAKTDPDRENSYATLLVFYNAYSSSAVKQGALAKLEVSSEAAFTQMLEYSGLQAFSLAR